MFDIGWQELFVVAIFALIVVGPKDLPKAIRAITSWIRKAKMMTREFQAGVNDMVREAELDDLKDTLTDPVDIKKTFTDAVDPDGSLAKDMSLSEDDLTPSVDEKITIGEAIDAGIVKPAPLNNVPIVNGEPPAQPKAKRTPVKKTTVKKTTVKKPAVKKTTVKKPVAKRKLAGKTVTKRTPKPATKTEPKP